MMPTWDLVLLVFFAASLVYGFLMGWERVMITLLGAYVGLVVANQWGAAAYTMLTGKSVILNDDWVHGNVSVFTVKVALFVIALLIVALRGSLLAHSFMGGRGFVSVVVQISYSFLSAALIASSILQFLPEDTKAQMVKGSIMVAPLVNFASWWLILPVILMAITGLIARQE